MNVRSKYTDQEKIEMLTTFRGVYRDGKIELEKPPRNV